MGTLGSITSFTFVYDSFFFFSEQYSGPNVGPSSARRREGNSSENAKSRGVLVSLLTNWHLMQLTVHGWKNRFVVFGKLVYCFQADFLIV